MNNRWRAMWPYIREFIHWLCTCNEKSCTVKHKIGFINVIFRLREDFYIPCQSFPPTFHTYLSIQPCITRHNRGCKTNGLSITPHLELTTIIRWQRLVGPVSLQLDVSDYKKSDTVQAWSLATSVVSISGNQEEAVLKLKSCAGANRCFP